MKKIFIPMLSILVLLMSLILIKGCKVDLNKDDYLRKVLNKLDQIESANYLSTLSVSAPNDTLKFITRYRYYKEYVNPTDTFIGSNFACFDQIDTSKMNWFYDGTAITYLDWADKRMIIDNFQNNTLPFRPVGPPFFNYTKSIIKYALETKDSISTSLKDFGDSIQFSLIIHDKAVEFFGKAFYMDLAYYLGTSRYDIWINKSDNQPYQYRRTTSANTSWETCKNVRYNNNINEDFASKYIPYEFTTATRVNQKSTKNNLVGKVAPDWILKDSNNNSISLMELKSKVLMIQFTGIGCGPCHASIPFLKQLIAEYKDEDFEFVSIESWSKNLDGIKRYQNTNDLNYKFLLSTEEITKRYQVIGVPVFFILDKNRVIRKIISGYGKDSTDKEIRAGINELL